MKVMIILYTMLTGCRQPKEVIGFLGEEGLLVLKQIEQPRLQIRILIYKLDFWMMLMNGISKQLHQEVGEVSRCRMGGKFIERLQKHPSSLVLLVCFCYSAWNFLRHQNRINATQPFFQSIMALNIG